MTLTGTTRTAGAARWVRRPRPVADPQARLVCLPGGGSTSAFYSSWAARLPERVELLSVQYPGRRDRFAEPPLTSIPLIADGVAAALAGYLDRPLYLFGHSMGSMVAYETAVRLEGGDGPDPVGLFVSGQFAPHRWWPARHSLDDATIEKDIRTAGWAKPEVFVDPQLRELVLPALLADTRAALSYYRPDASRLNCSIVVYAGDRDVAADPDEMSAWAELTSAATAYQLFEGDHFYIDLREAELVADIARRMSDCAPAAVGHEQRSTDGGAG